MTLLGGSALWLAFLLGVWGAIAGFAGGRTGRPDLQRSARHAVFAMCAALLTAVFSLEWALFHHDFNVEYVAAYTSRNLLTFYTWSALYAGQKGSLLFWATVLPVFGSLAQILTAGRHRVYLPYVAAVTAVVAAFFVSVMLFAANPFERLAYTPLDGRGMNPQLQNPGMVFHPPMLYLGYISITIPFAFAMAALISKRLDADWLVAIRKWTLLSWLFLSVGICLGMWWAYVDLGGGPGGERLATPLAHDDGVPAFGNDPGKARHAEEVEPGADHRLVAAQHPRYVHHPLGRDLLGALVHAVGRRVLLPRVPGDRRRHELHAVREAPAAARSRHPPRVDGEPRSELPVQQPAVRRDRVLGALRDAVPDPLRGGARHQGDRGPPVLQLGEHSPRAGPVAAHGDRAAHRMAPRVAAHLKRPFAAPSTAFGFTLLIL